MSIITKNENVDIGDEIQVTLHVNELLSHEKVNDSEFNDQSKWKRVFVYYKNESKTENETLIFSGVDSNSSSVAYFNPIDTTENFLVTMVIILTKQGTYLVIRRSDLVVEDFDVNYTEIIEPPISFDFLKKINDENENEYGDFGDNMSLSGDYLTVSSEIAYDQNGQLISDISQRYGKIHIYKKDEGGTDNWGHIKTITLNDGEGSYISYHKLLNKELLVLFGNDLYIYKKNEGGTDNWGLAKTITDFSNSFNPSTFDVHGKFMVATKNVDNSVFIFEKDEGGTDNWGLIQTIYINEGRPIDASMQGVNLIVKVGNISNQADKIYLYRKFLGNPNKWGFVTSITSNVLYPYGFDDEFGVDLLIHEDYIFAGTNNIYASAIGNQPNSKFYIFKKDQGGTDNWGLLKSFNPSDELTMYTIAAHKDILVIGAHQEDGSNNISDSGEVYVYQKDEGGTDNWGLIETLKSTNENVSDAFGRTIVISDEHLAIAAPADDGSDDTLNNAGEIHIYKY